MKFQRNIREKLEAGLFFSPVVLLSGARQTGKSTLMSEIAKEHAYTYVTFDNLSTLAGAKIDPAGFVEGLKKPAILDEVQRVPEIFLPIKFDVDQNRNPGRFALTGSANPLLISRLGDTLAGRMLIFELYPLSQGEMLGRFEDFIELVFSDRQPHFIKISKPEIIENIMTGGFPNILPLNNLQREQWFDNYITTIITREITELAKIEGIIQFPQLLRILAARAGGLLNVSELSRTSGIVQTTLHRYLALLQTIFLVYFLPPWSVHLENRLVKTPKAYLIDTGLLTHLLGIDQKRLAIDSVLKGALFENFVVMELKKQSTWSRKQAHLYHYRTAAGIEVDIVLEDKAGNIVGIEIKAAESVGPDDFKGLNHLKETYKKRFLKGIVLYTGSEIIPFGKNIFAWPISSLWAN